MKNSLDAAMQGIEGLINSDGSGENLAGVKHGEFGEYPSGTIPSRAHDKCEGVTTRRKP
jgi:hypothetical protein